MVPATLYVNGSKIGAQTLGWGLGEETPSHLV